MASSHDQATPESNPTLNVSALDLDDDAWFARMRATGPTLGLIRIGPYELLGEIARGGQGIVYKARQPRTGREIAIKRLSAGAFATADMRARFEREVEAAAMVDHPNIVTVYGSEIIDGQPVLAMQWVDGVPFDQWAGPSSHETTEPQSDIESRDKEPGSRRDKWNSRRSVCEVLEVFARVCDAVHHAHQRGLIHRDLKPSNILVVDERKEGAGNGEQDKAQPKILDFGLAKFRTDASSNLSITHTGQFVGTPAYAAPEQVRGDPSAVDVRTDVYALGSVLYQALTGATLFDRLAHFADLVEAIQSREPRTPSLVDPRLNHEIDAIILKAVAKEKEQRYASVDALATDIRRYLAGQAVLAHPPSTTYRVRKFIRHHRGLVGGATAFVLVLVGASVVSITNYSHAKRALRSEMEQRRQAELQEAKARKEAEKQAAVFQVLQDMIGGADRARQGGNPDVKIREALDAFVEKLKTGERAYLPEIDAAVRKAVADTYGMLGLFEEAAVLLTDAVNTLRTLEGAEGELANALTSLAKVLRRTSKSDGAETALREALAIYEGMPEEPRDSIAGVLNELALIEKAKGNKQEAVNLCRRALTIRRELYGERSDLAALTLNNLSLIVSDTHESLQLLEEALEIRRELPGDQRAETAVILGNMGMFQRRTSDFEAAKRSYDEAYAVLRELYGDEHHNTLIVNNNRARVESELGNLDESERILRDVLATRRKVYGNESEFVAVTLSGLGSLLQQRGRPAEALEHLEESRQISLKLSGPDSELVIGNEANLAATLAKLGRVDEAEELYRKTLDWRRKHLGDHAATSGNLHMLGLLLAERGEFVEAEAMLIESVAMSRSVQGADHLDVGIHLADLAKFYENRGRPAEAEPLYRESLAIYEKRLPSGNIRILGVQARLGSILTALGKFDEAANLLLDTEAQYSQNQKDNETEWRNVIRELLVLYEAWHFADPQGNHDAQAEHWRNNLKLFPPDQKAEFASGIKAR